MDFVHQNPPQDRIDVYCVNCFFIKEVKNIELERLALIIAEQASIIAEQKYPSDEAVTN